MSRRSCAPAREQALWEPPQFRAGPAAGESGVLRLPPVDSAAQLPLQNATTVIGEALVSDAPVLDAPITLLPNGKHLDALGDQGN